MTSKNSLSSQKWFAACCVAASLVLGPISIPLAAVPSLINYQGVLRDSAGVPYDGNATMVFSIWDDSANGSMCWGETQAAVSVSHGLFNVLLGSSVPIPISCFPQPNAWLQVAANGNELSPRRRIVSVAYAYRAADADTAEYARNAPVVPDDDWVIDGDNVYREQGNVGIGTASPSHALDVDGTARISGYVLGVPFGRIEVGDGNFAYADIEVTKSGSSSFALQDRDSGGGRFVVTHGATDGLTEFSTSADNPRLAFTGTDLKVGIGTTSPGEKLEVDGNAHITGNLTVDGNINPGGCWKHSGAQIFSGTGSTSWTDLDLSSHVGSNHALVLIKVKGASGSSVNVFRPNGESEEYWRCSDLSDMGAQGHKGECAEAGLVVLETDAGGMIEWRNNGRNVTLTLLGYVR